MGFSLSASIPTIVSGKEHSIMHILGGPSVVNPFEIDESLFVVDICMGDPQ
ncbi:MAG: hypothetical protein ABFD82_13630 [Syntrophaceae bacterium]